MIYGVINVCIAPEQHREAIERLKGLARLLSEKYGAETTLLNSNTGDDGCKQLVTRYQNQSQMHEIDRRLTVDAEFAAWMKDSELLVEWDCVPGEVYEVQ